MLRENLAQVQSNIREACQRAGREESEVTLIAVSKTKPLAMLEIAYRAGVREFGENKVQELVEKYEAMPGDIRWHMIGHLQRNKVKYVVDKACLIHSVDSLRLAEEISRQAVAKQVEARVLVEVNIAGEESKFGMTAQEATRLVTDIARLPGVLVRGLMTIAPFVENSEENRMYFRKMKELSVDIKNKNIDNVSMDILSMGMTGDYMVAIEEGATMVRVGTGIFGERHALM